MASFATSKSIVFLFLLGNIGFASCKSRTYNEVKIAPRSTGEFDFTQALEAVKSSGYWMVKQSGNNVSSKELALAVLESNHCDDSCVAATGSVTNQGSSSRKETLIGAIRSPDKNLPFFGSDNEVFTRKFVEVANKLIAERNGNAVKKETISDADLKLYLGGASDIVDITVTDFVSQDGRVQKSVGFFVSPSLKKAVLVRYGELYPLSLNSSPKEFSVSRSDAFYTSKNEYVVVRIDAIFQKSSLAAGFKLHRIDPRVGTETVSSFRDEPPYRVRIAQGGQFDPFADQWLTVFNSTYCDERCKAEFITLTGRPSNLEVEKYLEGKRKDNPKQELKMHFSDKEKVKSIMNVFRAEIL